ncbi:MAG: M23 family metallopeptidase [archaeon]
MKTKNIYTKPIDSKYISERITTEAPGHKKYEIDGHVYDLRNAEDFLCKEGTPIKASLEGKVIDIKDNIMKVWDEKTNPPEDFMPLDEQDGNYVVIQHENSELSMYSHLQPGSINVKPGDKIKTAQRIASSGHNGWSINPHLHYMVFRFTKPAPARDWESLEVQWKE